MDETFGSLELKKHVCMCVCVCLSMIVSVWAYTRYRFSRMFVLEKRKRFFYRNWWHSAKTNKQKKQARLFEGIQFEKPFTHACYKKNHIFSLLLGMRSNLAKYVCFSLPQRVILGVLFTFLGVFFPFYLIVPFLKGLINHVQRQN